MGSVVVERALEGVAILTLNRPDVLNALAEPMFEELGEAVDRIERDESSKVVIVTGAGRAFCAGHDLNELPAMRDDSARERIDRLDRHGRVMLFPWHVTKPVIAAVNGAARGGGFSLAVACDIRLASSQASFGVGYTKLGFSAGDAGLSWTLPRAIGPAAAADLMYTDRVLDASEAAAIGLVQRIVSPDDLMPKALAIAQSIAAHDLLALQLTKRALQASSSASLADAVRAENSAAVLAMMQKAGGTREQYLGLARQDP